MPRTSFLRPASALFLFAMIPIGAACNGQVVGLGDTGDTLQSVTGTKAAASASGSSGSIVCQAGWQHPNICCASDSSGTTCGAWEENPFRSCPSGDTTYPDLLSCCDLSNPSSCTDQGAVDASAPPPPYGCGFACPPGWWPQAPGAISPDGVEGAMCCTVYGTGTQCVPQGYDVPVAVSTCASGGSSTGTNAGGPAPTPVNGATDAGVISSPPAPVDAGPAPTEDAGTLPGGWIDDAGTGCYGDDAGSYNGWDGGMVGLCNPCPPNWSASDPAQPELCCQQVSNDLTLCFSQASGSGTSVGEDGGYDDGGSSVISTPPSTGSSGGSSTGGEPSSWGSGPAGYPDGGLNGPTCTGSSSTCSCDETGNGHTYALDCYATASGAITCTCSIDGTATSATPSVDSCQDESSVESAFSSASGCAFP